MNQANLRYAPAVSAALMACLIIRVFFELQNYGPESAILKFNQAVKADDAGALGSVTLTVKQPAKVGYLLRKLTSFYEMGARLEVAKMERKGNEVRAVVVYYFPTGTITGTIWVVERTQGKWWVDADKTATILLDNLGLGNSPGH